MITELRGTVIECSVEGSRGGPWADAARLGRCTLVIDIDGEAGTFDDMVGGGYCIIVKKVKK